jgi:hypothetical protein
MLSSGGFFDVLIETLPIALNKLIANVGLLKVKDHVLRQQLGKTIFLSICKT